jgi:hypothetical protein
MLEPKSGLWSHADRKQAFPFLLKVDGCLLKLLCIPWIALACGCLLKVLCIPWIAWACGCYVCCWKGCFHPHRSGPKRPIAITPSLNTPISSPAQDCIMRNQDRGNRDPPSPWSHANPMQRSRILPIRNSLVWDYAIVLSVLNKFRAAHPYLAGESLHESGSHLPDTQKTMLISHWQFYFRGTVVAGWCRFQRAVLSHRRTSKLFPLHSCTTNLQSQARQRKRIDVLTTDPRSLGACGCLLKVLCIPWIPLARGCLLKVFCHPLLLKPIGNLNGDAEIAFKMSNDLSTCPLESS